MKERRETRYREQLREEYKNYLYEEGKSKTTIESYLIDVGQFLEWIENKKLDIRREEALREINRFHIVKYKEEIQNKYKVNTYNKKINSLVHWNRYLLEREILEKYIVLSKKDKIKIAKGSNNKVEVYTEEEQERILFYIYGDKVNKRTKIIILLLLYTGIRVSEACSIKREDIDLLTRNIRIIGKGGKYREIPLKEEVVKGIQEYMEERKYSRYAESKYLLVSERSEKLHRDTILKTLKKLGKELGIEMYPHKYRHTFCSNLIKSNISISTVANLAGHANIQTTVDHYINIDKEDKKRAIEVL